MSDRKEYLGHCLCGAVKVFVKPAGTGIGVCHCGMCRRWTGGPLFALDCGSDLRIEGIEHVRTFASSDWAERAFCGTCGSHLYYRARQSNQHHLPVGLLDDQTPWKLDQQIFIDSKPGFYDLANKTENLTGAEVFAKYAPG
ncbi:MAG TPA: GFA family protein [Xanthomonadaceae bacterium]|nr:GFA family protein [Xanthomonadaceae bacterium]